MKPNFFKKTISIISIGITGLLILLFLLRLLYVFFFEGMITNASLNTNFFNKTENFPKNYASEKTALNKSDQTSSLSQQKYEKIAFIKTASSRFENDHAAIKKKIQEFNCIIQFEKESGIGNDKQSHFLVAVSPASFEPFYTAIQSIGVVKEKDITTADMTFEYERLSARKASLEKTLASLKGVLNSDQNNSFNVQGQILEMQTSLRDVEVKLAYFAAGRDFCTVKLSLYESATGKQSAVLPTVKSCFRWALEYYPVSLLAILLLLFFKNVDRIKLPDIIFSKSKS